MLPYPIPARIAKTTIKRIKLGILHHVQFALIPFMKNIFINGKFISVLELGIIKKPMAKPIRSMKRRILNGLNGRSLVFLGMMGCGKSAIGTMVARKLGVEFKDADTEIEEAAGRTVAEIFEEFGEEEFRRLEARVIERVLDEGPVVLALGGGAFMSKDTRDAISQSGLSIWLKADLDLLLARVNRKPGKRPLLNKGNPREILQKLLKEREPVYALADLHVASQPGTKSDMRNAVLSCLDEHLKVEQ